MQVYNITYSEFLPSLKSHPFFSLFFGRRSKGETLSFLVKRKVSPLKAKKEKYLESGSDSIHNRRSTALTLVALVVHWASSSSFRPPDGLAFALPTSPLACGKMRAVWDFKQKSTSLGASLFGIRQLPIFPGRRQPSIVGV